MTKTEKPVKCEKCQELRGIHLHLHELAMVSEYLQNEHDVYVYEPKTKTFSEKGTASTKAIAKWLRLASQLERVELNTFRYEVASLYCEPVADLLDSNAKHYESIATPLTRFMYVSNALEECYRFASPLYKTAYELLQKRSPKADYQRSYSVQAAYLLENAPTHISLPRHYGHLVDNFLKIIRSYVDQFHTRFDVELDDPKGLGYGLSLVRNIRNQIAHGAFPIIEDPEYTFDFDKPHIKRNIINLLGQASRIAALNIQMLLVICSKGFESKEYEALCWDDYYGKYFEENCNFSYLLNLHLGQKFGLNEQDSFSYDPESDDEN